MTVLGRYAFVVARALPYPLFLQHLLIIIPVDHHANRAGVYTGIGACIAFTGWATLTLGDKRLLDLGRFNFPWHDYMIGAIGNVVLFAVGYVASRMLPSGAPKKP